jgi:hypothetical protein
VPCQFREAWLAPEEAAAMKDLSRFFAANGIAAQRRHRLSVDADGRGGDRTGRRRLRPVSQ